MKEIAIDEIQRIFIRVAISIQQNNSAVVDTNVSESDFRDNYECTKKELSEAIERLRLLIN